MWHICPAVYVVYVCQLDFIYHKSLVPCLLSTYTMEPAAKRKEQEGGEAPSKKEQFWRNYKASKEKPKKKKRTEKQYRHGVPQSLVVL